MSFRIYVAAPWVEKDYAKEVCGMLSAAGIEPTSRWVNLKGDTKDQIEILKEALNDVEDVRRADGLLLLNLQQRGEETSGKAVETGIAIALAKPIFMVGESSNIFHYLPTVKRYLTIEEAIQGIVAYHVSRSY